MPMKSPAFAALVLLWFLTPLPAQRAERAREAPRPEPTEKQVYKTVGDSRLEIWIYKPRDWKASDRRGAIVFYHGGGWRGGNPTAFSRQSAKLAQRGMVAFSVQYRLTAQPGVTMRDCVLDARSAFRWVRSRAAELGIDPARIAAGGGSAGGHLAATLATLDDVNDGKDDTSVSTSPACLVLFNPAVKLDFPRAETVAGEGRDRLLSLSPYHHLKPGHPPTVIFHGEEDTTVPIQTARDYAAKVTELGGRCEVVAFPGEKHSFFNRDPAFSETLKQTEAYLGKQGLLR